MASIKQIQERKFKITVSNGYRPDGRKISRAKTITVPDSVRRKSVPQYVSHAAEEFERFVKNGFGEDANTSFEVYAERWLERQVKYAPGTIASYRRMLSVCYPYIGHLPLCKLRPVALENMMNELRKREYRGRKIQEKTVQKYLTIVSAVLSDAKRNEIIQKNPARIIDLPMTERRVQRIPSHAEAMEILTALQDEPFIYRTFYNDYRKAKTIVGSIVFAAKRQVWPQMIERIICAMLIAMNIWQNSYAVLLSSMAARRNALWRFAII